MNTPDFRKSEVQVWDFMGKLHKITYTGQCVICHKRVYDGMGASFLKHNDCSLVAKEHGKQGPDVPLCFYCSNDEYKYTRAVAWANKWRWIEIRDEQSENVLSAAQGVSE